MEVNVDEVTLVVGEGNRDLRERLDQEIIIHLVKRLR
jgi:hypothetical protein